MRAAASGPDRRAAGAQQQDPAPDHHDPVEQDEQRHDRERGRVGLQHGPERRPAVDLTEQVAAG